MACHFTVPERGGFKGWLGVAEEVSDISLACRQIGPIRFKAKFEQGEDMFRQRRSLFFKKMQIVRGCDAKRNVLVYMVYSDRLIEGSPKNSTSSVPIMPWGPSGEVQKCADWIDAVVGAAKPDLLVAFCGHRGGHIRRHVSFAHLADEPEALAGDGVDEALLLRRCRRRRDGAALMRLARVKSDTISGAVQDAGAIRSSLLTTRSRLRIRNSSRIEDLAARSP